MLAVPNLSANLSGTSVVGSIDIGFDTPRPTVSADLVTGPVVVERLVPVLALAATDPLISNAGASISNGDGERWSRAPIDLAALDTFDAIITLKAESLDFLDYVFDDVTMSASLANGTLKHSAVRATQRRSNRYSRRRSARRTEHSNIRSSTR